MNKYLKMRELLNITDEEVESPVEQDLKAREYIARYVEQKIYEAVAYRLEVEARLQEIPLDKYVNQQYTYIHEGYEARETWIIKAIHPSLDVNTKIHDAFMSALDDIQM
jgi:hypothetical protein